MATSATFRIWRGDKRAADSRTTRHPSRREWSFWTLYTGPGAASTRHGGAMELQGRQMWIVFRRNQRHAQTHVHDPAQ